MSRQTLRRKLWKHFYLPIIVSTIGSIAAYYLIKKYENPPIPSPPPTTLLEYRIKPEKPMADFDTLPSDNRVKSGTWLCFEVKLANPGSLYLLQESSDGSLKWINPVANNQAQLARAGLWLRIPDEESAWIEVGKESDSETFLMIYVPLGVDWSLISSILPQSLTIVNGFPTVQRDAANRVRTFISANASEMSTSPIQNGRVISYELFSSGDRNQIGFHELKLKYEP